MKLDLELLTRLTIVPREFLEPLALGDARNVCKADAAEILDTYLRQLSRREALARLVLGRIAEAFLRRSAHHTLGFARVGDYTRERLGLCASEFYELARVARELTALPFIASAFERGELGWTKLREITAVANNETEADWLELSRQYTADALKIIVRKLKSATGGAAGVAADELERFAARNIRAAVAQARREAGDLPPDSGADRTARVDATVSPVESGSAGDVSSGSTTLAAALEDDEIEQEPAVLFRLRCPRRVWRLWHRARELAKRVAGSDLADWQAAEAIAAESLSASGYADGAPSEAGCFGANESDSVLESSVSRYRATMMSTNYLKEPRDGEECPWGEDYDEIDVIRWQLPIDTIDEPLPDAIVALADGAYELDGHELDRRMRSVLAAIQLVDAQMGALLRTCCGLRLYLELGYRSIGTYVRNRLGMSSRKARGLVALERKSLYTSAELTRAYREGRLSWYRALMLLPILCEENADAWIECACAVPARRLRDELEWALEIQGNALLTAVVMPPPPGAPLTTRPCPKCGVEHDFSEFATNGAGAAGDERQIGGHGGAECVALRYPEEALAEVEIRIRGPVSVISLLYAAFQARKKAREPAWRAFERVLVHVVEHWESSPKHRKPIYARDGWRCAAPACSSRRNLHAHHIIFRSRMGGDEHDNQVTVCAWHHLRGIHSGTFRVAGLVSKGLVWEVGLRPGKPPLMRCAGEAYVDAKDDEHVVEVIYQEEDEATRLAAVA